MVCLNWWKIRIEYNTQRHLETKFWSCFDSSVATLCISMFSRYKPWKRKTPPRRRGRNGVCSYDSTVATACLLCLSVDKQHTSVSEVPTNQTNFQQLVLFQMHLKSSAQTSTYVCCNEQWTVTQFARTRNGIKEWHDTKQLSQAQVYWHYDWRPACIGTACQHRTTKQLLSTRYQP